MTKYIYHILKNTCLTKDIITLIINKLFEYKWKIIKRKIKIRINALSFNVITKLSIDNLTQPSHIKNLKNKKLYYMKYSKPLLFTNIKIIETKKNSYKLIILEKNNTTNKYITYHSNGVIICNNHIVNTRNGAIIWDNDIPRHSIMY